MNIEKVGPVGAEITNIDLSVSERIPIKDIKEAFLKYSVFCSYFANYHAFKIKKESILLLQVLEQTQILKNMIQMETLSQLLLLCHLVHFGWIWTQTTMCM